MKKLINTFKELTRSSIYEEVKDILNSCNEAEIIWHSFEEFCNDKGFHINTPIFVDMQSVIGIWLNDKPKIKDWLIRKGFAEEIDDFKPILFPINTLEEFSIIWHEMNMAEDRFIEAYSQRGEEIDPAYGVLQFDTIKDKNSVSLNLWERLNELRNEGEIIPKRSLNMSEGGYIGSMVKGGYVK